MRLTPEQVAALRSIQPEMQAVLDELKGVEDKIKDISAAQGKMIEELRATSHGELADVARHVEERVAALRARAQSDYASIYGRLHHIANFYYDLLNRHDNVIDEAEANSSTLPVEAIISPVPAVDVGSGTGEKP